MEVTDTSTHGQSKPGLSVEIKIDTKHPKVETLS